MSLSSRALTLSLGVLASAVVAAVPLHAQFEEPDTTPRFGIGPVIELTFRGTRAKIGDNNLRFDNGPAIGLRADVRLGRTVSFDVAGTWARSEEKLESGSGGVDTILGGDMTIWQLMGELIFRVKPSVPGYFVIGGGVRRVIPDEEDPLDPGTARFTSDEPFNEPIVTIGLGLQFTGGRHFAARPEIRWYIGPPEDLGGASSDTKSLSADFVLGFSMLYRF